MRTDTKAAMHSKKLNTDEKKDIDKNIVILFGSPHKTGNTAKILSAFLSEKPEGSNVYFYYCVKENANPCYDCGMCKIDNTCVNHELDDLMEELLKADYIIIASPIYNWSYPSPVKAVIDRFQRFYNAKLFRKDKLRIKRKYASLIFTSGSKLGGIDEFKSSIIKQTQPAMSLINAEILDVTAIDNTDEVPVVMNNIDNIFESAAKLFSAI